MIKIAKVRNNRRMDQAGANGWWGAVVILRKYLSLLMNQIQKEQETEVGATNFGHGNSDASP